MKEVKVLGPGCAKCQELMKKTESAVKELELSCEVEKITDIVEISSFGVMMTPALVINGKVVVSGRVPSVDELKQFLNE
ncbi:MAG: thioredoxin family protein [bacterium]|nr:thioredoxin family protein [bacterium]